MSEPSAWRTRWKNGSERDREWEMWTYRTEQPVPNDNQIIEALYAEPRSDHIEALEAALRIIAGYDECFDGRSNEDIARAALAAHS